MKFYKLIQAIRIIAYNNYQFSFEYYSNINSLCGFTIQHYWTPLKVLSSKLLLCLLIYKR